GASDLYGGKWRAAGKEERIIFPKQISMFQQRLTFDKQVSPTRQRIGNIGRSKKRKTKRRALDNMLDRITGVLQDSLILICTVLTFAIPYSIYKINGKLHDIGHPPWKEENEK